MIGALQEDKVILRAGCFENGFGICLGFIIRFFIDAFFCMSAVNGKVFIFAAVDVGDDFSLGVRAGFKVHL